MKHIKASNWVAETATPTSTGFRLRGTSKGYTTFSNAFGSGQDVFYSAHDDNGNREAGYARFNGTSLVSRHPTATLVAGVYRGVAPPLVNFSGDVTLACTFNASAFNLLFESLQALDPNGDGNINIPPDLIDGLSDMLRSKAEQADLDAEIAARKAGDDDLQAQIDSIDVSGGASDWGDITNKPTEFPPAAHNHDGEYLKDETDPTVPAHVKAITTTDIDTWNAAGSGGASTWDELTGKPTEFPPESHNHEIDDVNGLQDALDAAGGTPAWGDVTGKPTEFPPEAHTHEQSEVDGLEDRLEAIEDSITSGGGFVDAPDDGKLYGRQSENWAEVVIPDAADPDWADIQNKPTEFPPEAHVHTIANVTGLQDALDDKADADHTHEIADVNGLQDALDNAGGDSATYTLPVVLRSGNAQLPLTLDGAKLAVMTRGGELELPLAA